MQNKTYKRIIVVLLTLIISVATIISINIPNVEAKKEKLNPTLSGQEIQLIQNKWYGSPCGFPITLSFNKDYKYERTIEKQHEFGTWEISGSDIIMDKGYDNEMHFTLKENKLFANINDINYVFSTDPNFAKKYNPSPVCKESSNEDFNGTWKVTKISSGELTTQPKVLGIDSAVFNIINNKMSISVSGEILPKKLEKKDIELSLSNGSMGFHIDLVDKVKGDGTICILNDGTISMTLKLNNVSVTLYAENSKEDAGNR